MARATRSPKVPVQPQSFLDCLRHFLTPQVWKQVQRAFRPHQALRWRPQPLLFVVLVMTWCSGESLAERFETAKAFYVASYQRQRRPGKTLEGFLKALAHVPARALRLVAAAVRGRLEQVFAQRLLVDGFVPLGCDGSRLNCPRSPELEQRLRTPNDDGPPTVWVTAFVHLSLGLLWSWRLGGARASERDHLVRLRATLPRWALIVADAGYVGYQLAQALVKAQRSFLIRLSSKAPLYSTERVALSRFREGLAYYWPLEIQQQQQPPIPVRVLRIQRQRKVDVWLMTNVLAKDQLPRKTAGKFYRWRWRNEVCHADYRPSASLYLEGCAA